MAHLETYAIRDEQEKYFEAMKDQLGFNVQRNWSEDGKTGRLFILFIGLILRCRLRWIWNKKLKDKFPSSVDLIQEMMPIRINNYPDGTSSTTSFTDQQVNIASAFALEVPEMSTSTRQKKDIDKQETGPRKRGRPRGSTNKPKNAAKTTV